MLKIDEIYDFMRAARIVESKRDFSRAWLGRTGGYLAAITAMGLAPGVATLTTLALRLSDLKSHLSGSSAFNSSTTLRQITAELERLERETWQEIKRRCSGSVPAQGGG